MVSCRVGDSLREESPDGPTSSDLHRGSKWCVEWVLVAGVFLLPAQKGEVL